MKKFTSLQALFLMLFFVSFSFTSAQEILCVDRDGSFEAPDVFTDAWQYYQPVLDDLGYDYDYFEVEDLTQNGPDEATMSDYSVVFWFTGETWTDSQTMTSDDEFNLMLYLVMDGGRLLLSSQDYLYDRYLNYTSFSAGDFPYDVLGCVEVAQDLWHIEPDTGNVVGAEGSFAEGMAFTVLDIYTEETDDGLYIDEFTEHLGADLLDMVYPEPFGCAAYMFDPGTHRSIFSTVSYAAIIDYDIRKDLMQRSFAWLLDATNIKERNTDKNVMLVYPNPATTLVRVGSKYEMEEMWIRSSNGQVVDHFPDMDGHKINVNTSGYQAGSYIIELMTEEGISTSTVIVR
jgi:hypothetical protein